jgi:hypothetical protein
VAELSENQWEVDGLMLGDGTPYIVLGNDGLEDAADIEASMSDRQGDGVSVNRLRLRDRAPQFELGMRNPTEEMKDALRAVATRKADGVTPRLLRYRHRGVTKRMEYRPASGKALSMPGTYEHLQDGHVEATLRLHCADPVIYSDALEEETFGVISGGSGGEEGIVATNIGSLTATSAGSATLGTWSLSISSPFGCVNPYLRHDDFPGEVWQLAESFPPGGTGSIGYNRVTVRGGVVRSAGVKGPDGCPIPVWPCLRPGDNNLVMGCVSGSFTATFRYRSTW